MTDRIARLNAALTGRYSVESEVGQGGMATVYRAEDLRHHRQVALKVLKPELAAVVGAERFLAEIETTANLQHPHILPLYDSGEADTFLFYVMPYVEEDSLRERLDREHQLPVADAVEIATDVAEALDYAHRRGVIHRDIKPANVLMVDGKPMVSDFGIALAVGAAGGGRLTETGMSLGTPQYMSPEQATGEKRVGPATDIFALGCVLYEMLVGEPPYTGSSAQAILVRIITGEVPSVSARRESVPANVDSAIHKALEKIPADRFQHGRDFGRALVDPAFRHGLPGPRRRGNGLALGGSAIAGALVATAFWLVLRPAPEPVLSPVERFTLDLPPEGVPTVLPDGSGVIYTAASRLLLRRWADLTPMPILGTEGVGPTSMPVVSPTGDEVAFVVDEELRVAPLTGGRVRTLADSAFCCARWGADGFLYYHAVDAAGIRRVPAVGGAVEHLGFDGRDFQVLPGGEVAVYSLSGSVRAGRLATGETKVLAPGLRPFVTGGYLVFANLEGQILAAPFDVDAMKLSGPAVPLVDGVAIVSGYPIYGLSETGTLVYFTGPTAGTWQFVWVTRAGALIDVEGAEPFRATAGWRLSPDSRRVAFGRRENGNEDIWIASLSDGSLSRLTFDTVPEAAPHWTPDGEWITYRRGTGVESRLVSRRADGRGVVEPVVGDSTVTTGIWSPDGTWLILVGRSAAGTVTNTDILGFRPGVDTAAIPVVVTDFDEAAPAISWDGRWIAYTSDQTGRDEVFVRPFPNVADGLWQVSSEGGMHPMWAHNARELFYANPRARTLEAVAFTATDGTFRAGRPSTLFTAPLTLWMPPGEFGRDFFDVSDDDERFLMIRRYGEVPSAILVRNVFDGLKARVP